MDQDQPPARFGTFKKRAAELIKSPGRVQNLTANAIQKLSRRGTEGLNELRSKLQTAIALVNAWRTGEYQGVSNRTIVVLVAAILYFVVPMDVIPDFLLGWGLIDDLAVISYVFNQVDDEIEAFKTWQDHIGASQPEQTPVETDVHHDQL